MRVAIAKSQPRGSTEMIVKEGDQVLVRGTVVHEHDNGYFISFFMSGAFVSSDEIAGPDVDFESDEELAIDDEVMAPSERAGYAAFRARIAMIYGDHAVLWRIDGDGSETKTPFVRALSDLKRAR